MERNIYWLPSDFVNELTTPGLDTMAGPVPLSQYLCLNPKNGGNARINELLGALRGSRIRDDQSGLSIDQTVGSTELDLLWKGQGTPDAFVAMMDFLCENQDQLKSAPGVLGRVYATYFRDYADANALKKMVADKYFGIDCIGFVANYLRDVRLWDKYYGYEIDQWDRVFTQNVRKPTDVKPLQLIVWPGSHVALIDWVWNKDDSQVDVDVCQSSSGGPQCNAHVTLKLAGGQLVKGYTPFSIAGGTPTLPVTGTCYVMSWPGLQYGDFTP